MPDTGSMRKTARAVQSVTVDEMSVCNTCRQEGTFLAIMLMKDIDTG